MTKSTSEMLATLNTFRAIEGKEPIAKWKKSRSDLEKLLSSYENEPETEAEQEQRLMNALETVEAPATERMLREEYGVEPGWKSAEHFDAIDQSQPLMEIQSGVGNQPDMLVDPDGVLPPVPLESDASTPTKSPRGAIGVMVMDLLQTDMPYKDIVAKVRKTYWDARTTERSIASVAMDLRRNGIHVPPRRKPAAVKPPQ